MAVELEKSQYYQETESYDGPALDTLPKKLAQRILNATRFLSDESRGRLLVWEYSHQPDKWKFGSRKRVFDSENHQFRLALIRNKSRLFEICLEGAVSPQTRRNVGRQFGFNSHRVEPYIQELAIGNLRSTRTWWVNK